MNRRKVEGLVWRSTKRVAGRLALWAGCLVAAVACVPGQHARVVPTLVRPVAAHNQPAPSRLRLLAVGASITAGYGASRPSAAYTDQLASLLRRSGTQVSLVTVARAGARAPGAASWQIPGRADVAVVQIASNDYLRATPLPVYSSDYRTLVGHVRAASPEARLVCLGVWSEPNRRNRIGLFPASYDSQVKAVCQANRGSFVSLAGVFTDPADHGPVGRVTVAGPGDRFHPNDAGHRRIAQAVYSALGPVSRLPQAVPSAVPKAPPARPPAA